MKPISVSLENWRKIREKTKELNLRHNNDVISYLFNIEKKYMSSESSIGKMTSGEDEKKERRNSDEYNDENNDMWDI